MSINKTLDKINNDLNKKIEKLDMINLKLDLVSKKSVNFCYDDCYNEIKNYISTLTEDELKKEKFLAEYLLEKREAKKIIPNYSIALSWCVFLISIINIFIEDIAHLLDYYEGIYFKLFLSLIILVCILPIHISYSVSIYQYNRDTPKLKLKILLISELLNKTDEEISK